MFAVAGTFLLIALLYSMVGFGGGSSYTAVLAASGVPHTMVPKVSLACNLLVVTGGLYHYLRQGHFSARLTLPFVLSSVPLAFLGGSFPITEKAFMALLATSLVLCGLRILFLPERKGAELSPPSFPGALLVGGVLGLLAGMIGIGGGIFLSPVLIYMGWARAKPAAATAAAFIFLNSFAGLAGQFSKHPELGSFASYWPLFIAVAAGGQVGSRIGSHHRVSSLLVQRGTGVLTLLISLKLMMKLA